ncbi:hypothetical protein J2Z32_002322 [Paenibacillus turicensis]|uniref:Uncharacterized protein n=1 Tax=Paenibacillus turicensis TaxID=160487 RepID=A0ABS4FSW7_9BACL|nr:hypothetical protein [Paenibacillus turicensis]
MKKCGCGREAEYEVYEHKEPHCESCFKEALECSVQILAKKIDYFEDGGMTCTKPLGEK